MKKQLLMKENKKKLEIMQLEYEERKRGKMRLWSFMIIARLCKAAVATTTGSIFLSLHEFLMLRWGTSFPYPEASLEGFLNQNNVRDEDSYDNAFSPPAHSESLPSTTRPSSSASTSTPTLGTKILKRKKGMEEKKNELVELAHRALSKPPTCAEPENPCDIAGKKFASDLNDI
ncbi:unnamed protein product [Acanthoscelides obtectus]|uniref:Uncharacterized protein n=1 Tax=Acanthoscelides obtectus TaxID=200917 RepID=A0A9P0LJM7_ACAOB|nr:unnamed protein product [Acanthoscelides obtectus]CAK1681813.1 hypothetical protein AOBTE_LOCUS33287 [Acanthoscelides obtectus]